MENELEMRDMAKLLNISPESYSMKEKSKTQFKADEMFLLSGYFGLPMEQIFLPRNFKNTEVEEV